MLAQTQPQTKADAARWTLQPRQTVKVNYTLEGYFVSIESKESLKVVNGELLTKREAFDLAAEVKQQLVLQRLATEASPNRMARAMALVADGKVHAGEHGQFIVESQTERDVTYTDGRHGCDCPDKVYNDAPKCKHEMAVALAEKMGEADFLNAELDALRNGKRGPHVTDDQLITADEPVGYDESVAPWAH